MLEVAATLDSAQAYTAVHKLALANVQVAQRLRAEPNHKRAGAVIHCNGSGHAAQNPTTHGNYRLGEVASSNTEAFARSNLADGVPAKCFECGRQYRLPPGMVQGKDDGKDVGKRKGESSKLHSQVRALQEKLSELQARVAALMAAIHGSRSASMFARKSTRSDGLAERVKVLQADSATFDSKYSTDR